MITIKKNPYVQPTELRDEAVQAICDAFLGVGGDGSDTNANGCHVFRTQGVDGKGATPYVARHNSRPDYSCFRDEEQKRDIEKREPERYTIFRIRGVEMSAAFEALQNAGYFMFGQANTTGESLYRCYCKPYLEGWGMLTSFKKFID